MSKSVSDIRKSYDVGALNEGDVQANPIDQFEIWLAQALKTQIMEPTAMHLATTSQDGRPSGRMVLLKDVSAAGFVFYSNYESRKGQNLATNPFAAMTFYWDELERQVRIEGRVAKLSREASLTYFKSRPPGSQMGAAASRQSQVLKNRKELEDAMKDLEAKHGEDIPLPDDWGGYQLEPDVVEFWQGRPSRLHDRLSYKLHEGAWRLERLSP